MVYGRTFVHGVGYESYEFLKSETQLLLHTPSSFPVKNELN